MEHITVGIHMDDEIILMYISNSIKEKKSKNTDVFIGYLTNNCMLASLN